MIIVMTFLRALSWLGLLAIIGLVCFAVYLSYWFSTPKLDEAPGQSFLVERGWPLQKIASALSHADLVSSPTLFSWSARLAGDPTHIHAGEYLLAASMTPAQILQKFTEGDVILHQVTLPEGMTSFQLARRLEAETDLSGAVEIPTEGSLLPETYSFAKGMPRHEVVEKMQSKMTELVDQLWAERLASCPLSSKVELITMASIVEKETGLPAERPLIAAVFLNRLRKGMPLQADPTVVYGLTQGKEPLGRRLLKTDLETENPYNTYKINGLPPGPIANPGEESLRAVMYPADVSYLYFVANGKGGHVFADTLEQHKQNHAAWRKIRTGL